MNESIKMVLILVIISVMSAAALTLVYELTYPIIQENKLGELKSALKEALPEANDFEEMNLDYSGTHIIKSYKGLKSGQLIGYAFLSETPGFQGFIKVLISYSEDKILNVIILEHTETPGLGSRITDKEFTNQFKEKKECDTITGATISSKAVIDSVNEVKDYLKELK